MMKRLILIAATAAFLVPARADDQSDLDKDCGGDGNTLELVECLSGKTAQWDKRLNVAYERGLKNAVSDRQREQLRAAQRLWMQYRDANCLYYALGEGTIARLNSNSCILDLTAARARELEALESQ